MISTNAKRIIFIGDWDMWTDRWVDLEDKSRWNLPWGEFSGWSKDKQQEIKIGEDKFSRVIDSSEYVVRCSWLRTHCSGKFSNKNMYGKKVDAIQLNGKNLLGKGLESDKFKGFVKGFLNPTDLTRTENNYTSDENFSNPILSRPDNIRYRHEATRIYSEMFYREIWVSLGYLYRKLNVLFLKKDYKKIEYIMSNVSLVMDKYSELYKKNISMLNPELFLSLKNEINNYYLTYDEMKDLYNGAKWWAHVTRKESDPDKKHFFEDIISGQQNSMMINRGLQSIYIGLNDKRFEDYEKYIIGYWGIDQTFSHGPVHYNQIAEYRLLTSWIDSGILKYLPEHIDTMNQDYLNSCKNSFKPLYQY